MTTAVDKAAKAAYDKARRPIYKARKAALRRERWKGTEAKNQRRAIADPERWPKYIIRYAKQRAKRKGLVCTIQPSDIVVPSVCPVLGIEIILGGGKNNPNSPSLDRFDNSLGYVPGNVRVISLRANLLKKDATLEEMEALVAYMKGEGSLQL